LPQARRINLALAAGVSLFTVAIIVAAASLDSQQKRSAINAAQSAVVRVAGSSEASFNRNLLGVDLLLAETANLVALAGFGDDAQAEDNAATLLRGLSTANLNVRHITLVDEQGTVVMSSDPGTKRMGIALPNGFLREVFAQAVPTLAVSAPSMSFARSEQVLYMARAIIVGKNRRVAAVAEVSLAALTDTITRSGSGSVGGGASNGGYEISFERGNGQLLASVPPHEDRLGTLLTPALAQNQGTDSALTDQPARLSGKPAIVVSRSLLYPGLLVVASLPTEFALNEWYKSRAFVWGAACAFIALIAAAALLSRSYLLRMMRARTELAQSKATVDQALDSMEGGFLLLDASGDVVTWNQRYLDMHPWLVEQMSAQTPFRICQEMTARALFADGDHAGRDEWLREQGVLNRKPQIDHEQNMPDGRALRVFEKRTPEGGRVTLFWDITERKLQEAAVLASKAQLQATIDAIPDVLFEVSLDGYYRSYHSPRGDKITIPASDLTGQRVQDVMDPAATEVIMAALSEANAAGTSLGKQFAVAAAAPREGKQWFELSVSRKPHTVGEELRFIVISRDITASRAAAEEIEHLAFYDPLTDLPNRRLLMERLKQALASSQRRSRGGALLFIDLDNFKTINDTLGHEMGDKLLLQVARRLAACVRKSDTVARLGGDEFVILLEDIAAISGDVGKNAGIVSEKVRLILSQPYLLDSQEYQSTVSIGITLFTSPGNAPDELVKQADIAMYQAKSAGRNAIRFFDPNMQSVITQRVSLEKDMRVAVLRKQFALHYQRQVTHDGKTVGAEALIRWMHPTRGLVMPGEFIPLAEENGLIVHIGQWVIETACTQLSLWAASVKTKDLQLSINVSAHQFKQANFVEHIVTTLARTGAKANSLTLELTESVMLENMQDSIDKIKSLGNRGIRFSIDDFGTGHSSLAYLSTLPITQLKIAQPFVDNIGKHQSGAAIVDTIIGMTKNLGLEVIAEGVETEAQRAFLQEHGCSLCQGYFFGRPVPIEEFERSI
jgi:diguanylate cyclase (GGDEF)-like protein